MEKFSYAVAAKGFVYGEGRGESACDAGYMGSDVAIEGAGFDLWLVGFGRVWRCTLEDSLF